jgi:EmrB/QacA subfamily drug resistance transporter
MRATRAERATVQPAPVGEMSHRQIMLVLLALGSASFMAGLDATILQTALPRIAGEFGGASRLGWLSIGYLLTSTIATPLTGKISDLYGRRAVMQASIALFLVGSVAAALSQDMGQLIVARSVQGLGGGGLMSLPMSIMADIVSPAQRGRYSGYIGAVYALAAVTGPFIGGFIVDHASWHWCFWVNLPVGIAAAAVVQAKITYRNPPREHMIDWTGAALITVSVTPLLLALVWSGERHGWGSATTMGLFGSGLVAAVILVLHEAKAPEAIIPMRFFRIGISRTISAAVFVVGSVMFGATLFLPLFLQVVAGVSATNSGLLIMPMMLGTTIASIASGRLIVRFQRYRPVPLVALALMTGAFVWLATLDTTSAPWAAIAPMFVMGLGMGPIMLVSTLATQNVVEHRDMGAVTSSVQFYRAIGNTFGAGMFTAIFSHRLTSGLNTNVSAEARATLPDLSVLQGSPEVIRSLPPEIRTGVIESFSDAIHATYLVAIPLCLVALAFMAFLKERPLRRSVGDSSAETVSVGAPPLTSAAALEV